MDISMNAPSAGRAAVVADEATQLAAHATPDLQSDKRLNTARARIALWGGTLLDMEGDDGRPMYVVTRWQLTRSFENLDEIDGFLKQVGVRAS